MFIHVYLAHLKSNGSEPLRIHATQTEVRYSMILGIENMCEHVPPPTNINIPSGGKPRQRL